MSIINSLIEYMHDALVHYWELLGVDTFKSDHILLASTHIPFSFMNVLIHLSHDIKSSDLPEIYAQANQFFRSRNAPWTWWLDPFIAPPGLDKFLTKRGYAITYACPSMALDLSYEIDQSPIKGFTIKEVISKDDFIEWLKPIRVSFNCPQHVFDSFALRLFHVAHGPEAHFRHFIAQENGKTMASSTIHLSHRVATIYNIATLPEARRKGYGKAITAKTMLAAKERNLAYCFLDSSKIGYNMYHGLGFRQFSECKIYGHDKS